MGVRAGVGAVGGVEVEVGVEIARSLLCERGERGDLGLSERPRRDGPEPRPRSDSPGGRESDGTGTAVTVDCTASEDGAAAVVGGAAVVVEGGAAVVVAATDCSGRGLVTDDDLVLRGGRAEVEGFGREGAATGTGAGS